MTRDAAPGRPQGRSGAIRLVVLLMLPVLGACDAIGGGDTIALDSADLAIPGTAHEVRIAGAGAADSIRPARTEARPGDAIRFVIADRRTHALTFTVDALSPDVREFLDGTGQLRGPPLVNEGSTWVVVLEDAPAGRYPFYCRSHDAAGEIVVQGEG